MSQKKTPGVYIVEKNAFPNSVVEVATAVPAFIGYTERAARGNTDLTNEPTRLTTLAEFELLFGGPPNTEFKMTVLDGKLSFESDTNTRFLLYYGMRLFFDNGGGPCWIVSIGGYGDAENPVVKSGADFDDAWLALTKEQEPTMIVMPDAVLLPRADYYSVSNRALKECADLQSRVAILDIFDGDQPRSHADDDVISGTTGFRNQINSDHPSYGMAYYPWLNTNIVEWTDIKYTNLDKESRTALHDLINEEQKKDSTVPPAVTKVLSGLKADTATPSEVEKTHQSLSAFSDVYKEAMVKLLEATNVLPPSVAMAGVYTRTDNNSGVFNAPANTGIVSALSPTVTISHEDQEDLNAPLDGKSINAIRTFAGRGVLVWGARTLDGNSEDWRYINVRRTLIMLEQSIKYAAEAYIFAPNDAGTWQTVKSMLENFLNNQWKAGALAGSKPEDAYDVSVGLGSTMTGNDILDGYMRITVKVAVTHPAEFIVITFQQKMQTS